jgi:ribosomal protein S27AE
MPSAPHIHKVRRKVYGSGNKVYFCTLPDCYFKIDTGLALGKKFLCNRCGEPFVMNQYSLRLAKPHCEKCHKTKDDDVSIRTLSEGTIKDRRQIPTRRELDPTVLPEVADATISKLKNKLSGGITYQEIPDLLIEDSEDDML